MTERKRKSMSLQDVNILWTKNTRRPEIHVYSVRSDGKKRVQVRVLCNYFFFFNLLHFLFLFSKPEIGGFPRSRSKKGVVEVTERIRRKKRTYAEKKRTYAYAQMEIMFLPTLPEKILKSSS